MTFWLLVAMISITARRHLRPPPRLPDRVANRFRVLRFLLCSRTSSAEGSVGIIIEVVGGRSSSYILQGVCDHADQRRQALQRRSLIGRWTEDPPGRHRARRPQRRQVDAADHDRPLVAWTRFHRGRRLRRVDSPRTWPRSCRSCQENHSSRPRCASSSVSGASVLLGASRRRTRRSSPGPRLPRPRRLEAATRQLRAAAPARLLHGSAQDTDYILLDEPLNNLDMRHSVQILAPARAATELGRRHRPARHQLKKYCRPHRAAKNGASSTSAAGGDHARRHPHRGFRHPGRGRRRAAHGRLAVYYWLADQPDPPPAAARRRSRGTREEPRRAGSRVRRSGRASPAGSLRRAADSP